MPGYPCFTDGECLGGGVCAGSEAPLIGPRSPGTGTNNACGGTNWINTGNVTVADGVYAQSSAGVAGLTACLEVTNFGFTVDAGRTIEGIIVEPKKRESAGSSDCIDVVMRLMKAGVVVGTDHSSATEWTTSTTAYTSYGSSSDMWGTTWTPAEVNATGFGFQIQANCTGGAFDALMDHARITVASILTGGVATPCPAGGVCVDTNQNVHYKSTQLVDRWQLETMFVRPVPRGNSLEGTARFTPNEHMAVGLPPGTVFADIAWDPPSIATGTATSTTVVVSRGNRIGDPVLVSFSQPVPAGATLTGQITAINTVGTFATVTVTLLNMTGGNLDLDPGTLHVEVLPR